MVSDFSTSFISEALNSRRADSPGPNDPSRSKKPTPCLDKITVRTGSSAGKAGWGRVSAAHRRIDTRQCFRKPPWLISLFAHRFNDDAFGALSVELGIID